MKMNASVIPVTSMPTVLILREVITAPAKMVIKGMGLTASVRSVAFNFV